MRYFFHLQEVGGCVTDEEGLDLGNLEEVVAAATTAARAVMAADVVAGMVPLRSVIEVDDETGARVLTLPFRDTVLVDG